MQEELIRVLINYDSDNTIGSRIGGKMFHRIDACPSRPLTDHYKRYGHHYRKDEFSFKAF
jgi:hypothetical protein